MDLLSTVRKSGSRGGVNFSWDEVANSSHRENYLGHSLKAPVGRWQQGRDLNWYAKGDSESTVPGETDEERRERERKEELRKVKEAEEDAMAAALGLPPPQRNTSGANAIEVDGKRLGGGPADQAAAPTVEDKSAKDDSRHGRSRRHEDRDRRERRRHRSRSRDERDRRERHRPRDRSRDRADHEERKPRQDRSRSLSRDRDRGRRERRHRERSRDRDRDRRRDRQPARPHRERRRSYSPRESRR